MEEKTELAPIAFGGFLRFVPQKSHWFPTRYRIVKRYSRDGLNIEVHSDTAKIPLLQTQSILLQTPDSGAT